MAVAKRLHENLKAAKDVLTDGLEDAVQDGIGAHKGISGLRDGVLPVIGAAIDEAIGKELKEDEATPEAPAETPTPDAPRPETPFDQHPRAPARARARLERRHLPRRAGAVPPAKE